MKTTAIVLAGGSGSRMKSSTKKQYLLIDGKPVLYYSLKTFQDCALIDEIILVCGKEDMGQCRSEIVERYGFDKVTAIVPGGKERYHSVYEGLKAISECSYVLIHDGARPFVDEDMIRRILDRLPVDPACVVGMPVKDTIKMSNADGYVAQTLPRELLWTIQTPQSFEYQLIRRAYDRIMELMESGALDVNITDDAMVAEYTYQVPIRLLEGSYDNIKITTPEDMILAETILRNKR